MNIILTNTDHQAIQDKNSQYLLEKGAKYYANEDYAHAIAYYHLAASMGNMQAVSNLGYCYMYARSVPKNMSLALAYFQLSANAGVIDSLYKLGQIYQQGKDVPLDNEKAIYYYKQALDVINNNYQVSEDDYPSLYLTLAQAKMPDGILYTDLELAFEYLIIAISGYEKGVANGARFWMKPLEHAESLIKLPIFKEIALNYNEDDDEY